MAQRFLTEINERRQRDLGVTHYIWRSLDDPRIRTIHAERDDRLLSWDDRFSDGHPGHDYNCRCSAEPAMLDGAILRTEVTLSEVGCRALVVRAERDSGTRDGATNAERDRIKELEREVRQIR